MVIKLLSLFCLFFLLTACFDSSDGTVSQTRSDCIVKLNIEWPLAMAAIRREEIIENIARVILSPASYDGFKQSPDIAMPGDQRDVLFLQFRDSCESRFRLADRVVRHINEVIADAPEIIVSTENILPGPDTIDVWGEAWSDKPAY